MNKKRYICLVRQNKASGHKFVTIPKDDPFEAGEYVEVMKLAEPVTGDVCISLGSDKDGEAK